jgi:hypothetical protein
MLLNVKNVTSQIEKKNIINILNKVSWLIMKN